MFFSLHYRSRYIKYNFRESRKTNNKIAYFHIDSHYFNFNEKVFSKVLTKLNIIKFQESKSINLLNVFPLHYHASINKTKTKIIECDQKFVFLMNVHHAQY